MNKLETLLNEPEAPKLPVTESPKPVEKPTAAASKANTLDAQERAIAAASVGSAVFRSAAAYLAVNTEHQKRPSMMYTDQRNKAAVA
jgi:hypothetical protein